MLKMFLLNHLSGLVIIIGWFICFYNDFYDVADPITISLFTGLSIFVLSFIYKQKTPVFMRTRVVSIILLTNVVLNVWSWFLLFYTETNLASYHGVFLHPLEIFCIVGLSILLGFYEYAYLQKFMAIFFLVMCFLILMGYLFQKPELYGKSLYIDAGVSLISAFVLFMNGIYLYRKHLT